MLFSTWEDLDSALLGHAIQPYYSSNLGWCAQDQGQGSLVVYHLSSQSVIINFINLNQGTIPNDMTLE